MTDCTEEISRDFQISLPPKRTKTQDKKLADGAWWRERLSGLILQVSRVARPWDGKGGVSDYFGSKRNIFSKFQIDHVFEQCFYFNLKHTHTHAHMEDLERLPLTKGESQWECINSQQTLTRYTPHANCKIYSTAVFLCMDQKMMAMMMIYKKRNLEIP